MKLTKRQKIEAITKAVWKKYGQTQRNAKPVGISAMQMLCDLGVVVEVHKTVKKKVNKHFIKHLTNVELQWDAKTKTEDPEIVDFLYFLLVKCAKPKKKKIVGTKELVKKLTDGKKPTK